MKVMKKKGQYRIISEIFLFAIGVFVTIFIVMSFQGLESKTKEYSTRDQLQQTSNIIASAILKSAGSNSTVKIYIGRTVGNYRVAVETGYLTVSLADNPKINVTRFLNMGEYNIYGNAVSDYIIITSNGTAIEIRGS